MLMMHHPLEGKKEADIKAFDLPAMNKIYGKEPVFIFDPQDNSNRPVAGYQDNALIYWPLYPAFLQDLFIRAFVDGVRSPDRRVRESEWRGALIRLRDSIVYCGHCKAENFYDAAKGSQPVCWACKKPVTVPVGIRIGSSVVMLNAQTSLYPHHLDSTRPYDFSTPWAVVQQHPQNPNLWGLKNLTASPWQVVTPDGRPAVAEPQRSVSLAKGTRIQFGMAEGEIC